VVRIEAEALRALADRLGAMAADFNRALDLDVRLPGQVVVTGMGRAADRAQIAATLSSTGSPALYCIR